MDKASVALAACFVLVAVLLGSAVGGIAGNHSETQSADTSRLLIGAVTTGAIMLAAGVYLARRKRWVAAATIGIFLFPATYFSATLAQTVGLWWDRL